MQRLPASRLTQFLMTAILGLLVWIAVRPSVPTVEAAAAQFGAGPIQVRYKVVSGIAGSPAEVQEKLTALGNDGWTLVQCTGLYSECIFKK